MLILDKKTANGSGNVVNWGGAAGAGPDGNGTFSVWGTWGGATCSLEFSPDKGTTWIPVGAASTFTQDGVAKFSLNGGKIRATISGATGTTSLSASV